MAPIFFSTSEDRLFPEISSAYSGSPNVDASLNPDQLAAVSLFGWAGEELSALQKYLGWGLDPRARMVGLLQLHRGAFSLEQAGQWQRADFFWRKLNKELASPPYGEEFWDSVATSLVTAHPEAKLLGAPGILHQRFFRELLIDSHAAFHNGYAQEASEYAGQRAAQHLEYLRQIVELSPLNDRDKQTLRETAMWLHIETFVAANKWGQAIEVCRSLLALDRESLAYQNKLIDVLWQQVCNVPLTREHVERGLQQVETLRNEFPFNETVYERLADLYYLHAQTLAAQGYLSSALVRVQYALVLNPASTVAAESMRELSEAMLSLISKAGEVRVALADNPTARLTQDGITFLDEAKAGFKPRDDYRDSVQARNAAATVAIAKARTLWHRMGLAEPADRWNARASKLLNAVNQIRTAAPPTSDLRAVAWREIARLDSDLNQLDEKVVCGFLQGEFQGEGDPREKISAGSPAKVPMLAATEPSPKQAGEPMDYWLMSRRDLRLKLQGVAAIVLLLVVGGLIFKDLRARSIRTATYHNILQAANDRQYLQVIQGAENFLSHPLVATDDARDAEVIKLYNEALVLWVARQPGSLNTEAENHVKRYRELVERRN